MMGPFSSRAKSHNSCNVSGLSPSYKNFKPLNINFLQVWHEFLPCADNQLMLKKAIPC
jgi:hypothetical protein